MVSELEIKVRTDGSINLRKSNNAILGIRPGSAVAVRIDSTTGSARITPLGFVCTVCHGEVKSPLNGLGICKRCNADIVKLVTENKYADIAEAIAAVKKKNTPKVVKPR